MSNQEFKQPRRLIDEMPVLSAAIHHPEAGIVAPATGRASRTTAAAAAVLFTASPLAACASTQPPLYSDCRAPDGRVLLHSYCDGSPHGGSVVIVHSGPPYPVGSYAPPNTGGYEFDSTDQNARTKYGLSSRGSLPSSTLPSGTTIKGGIGGGKTGGGLFGGKGGSSGGDAGGHGSGSGGHGGSSGGS